MLRLATGDSWHLAVGHEECGRTRVWCNQQKRWHLREGCASDIMHSEHGGPGELSCWPNPTHEAVAATEEDFGKCGNYSRFMHGMTGVQSVKNDDLQNST
jgi:hypothetical protein